MAKDAPFKLEKLFEGSLIRLRTEAEYFSRLTNHNPELGRLNESHLVRLLRDYLPPKIGIGTGFVVSGGKSPAQSAQCDIILYDALNNAPLYSSPVWSIYPIEMVYAVIEVKTTLTSATLKEAFINCGRLRAMARTKDGQENKAYMRRLPFKKKTPARYEYFKGDLPPRFYVFGYDGWKQISALRKNFKKLTQEGHGAHIHGVCSLHETGSQYIRHQAWPKTEDDRYLSVSRNGFHRFLLGLPAAIDSMLPRRRNGLGFDLVDLEHYKLSVE